MEVDTSKDAAICRHCGTPFIIEKAINNYVINNANLNMPNDAMAIRQLGAEFEAGMQQERERRAKEEAKKIKLAAIEKEKGDIKITVGCLATFISFIVAICIVAFFSLNEWTFLIIWIAIIPILAKWGFRIGDAIVKKDIDELNS